MVKPIERCQKKPLCLHWNDHLSIARPDCGGRVNHHTSKFTLKTSRAKCSEEISHPWCQQKVASVGCLWSVCCRCWDVEIDIEVERKSEVYACGLADVWFIGLVSNLKTANDLRANRICLWSYFPSHCLWEGCESVYSSDLGHTRSAFKASQQEYNSKLPTKTGSLGSYIPGPVLNRAVKHWK